MRPPSRSHRPSGPFDFVKMAQRLWSPTWTASASSSEMDPATEPAVFHFAHALGSSEQFAASAAWLYEPMQFPFSETVTLRIVAFVIGRMIGWARSDWAK